MDTLGQTASATRLRHLLKAGLLDRAGFERALELAGIAPDGHAWRRFLDWLLAGLGAALLLSGMVFFFAYNWADMHRFSKFALLEVTLLIGVALAWRLGPDSQAGRSALFGAAVLPGVLLAVYGQVYQTGADPYGLFLTWCLLVTPWVLIGRLAALWLLWLALANLSLILWWTGVHRPPQWLEFAQMIMPLFGMGFVFTDADLAFIVVAINAAALLLYEMLASRVAWLSGRWMPRVIMLAILATLIVPVLRAILQDSIFDDSPETRSIRLAPLLWMGLSAAGVWAYLNWRRDLFMLAALALEAIIIASAFLGKQLHWNDAGGMLLLSLLVALMTGAAAWWLRQTARRWEGES
jgi:uncharacterized membrane protein